MSIPAIDRENAPLQQWVDLLHQLVDEIAGWVRSMDWSVHEGQKTIQEKRLGAYVAPTLRIRAPQGEIHVDPVARSVMGADGRVDIEAWPSLNRVRLVRFGDQWRVITDSNVRLRKDWDRNTFLELVGDLVAA